MNTPISYSKLKRFYIFIILIVIAVVYFNAITGEFIWDEYNIIVHNPHIKNFNRLPELLTRPYLYGISEVTGKMTVQPYFRPVVFLSFAVDYSMWGLNSVGYHIINIILHMIFCIILFLFFCRITNNQHTAFLGTIFFAIHPIHTEAVTYISGRADILGSLFPLMCVFFFLKYMHPIALRIPGEGNAENKAAGIDVVKELERIKSQGNDADMFIPEHILKELKSPEPENITTKFTNAKGIFYLCVSFICYVLGLLSKESGIVTPLLILLMIVYMNTVDMRKDLFRKKSMIFSAGMFLFITVLYVIFRLIVFMKVSINGVGVNILPRIIAVFHNIILYVRLLIFPFPLFMDRQMPAVMDFAIQENVFLILCVTAAAWLLFRLGRKKPQIRFGLCWFFLTLLPVSGIMPLQPPVAEHYMYLPSIGLFLIFAVLIRWILDNKSILLHVLIRTGLLLYAVMLGSITLARNVDYLTPVRFFYMNSQFNPTAKLLHQLADHYYYMQKYNKAIDTYERVLELQPNNPKIYRKIGANYHKKGNLKSAEKYYRKALQLCPDYEIVKKALKEIEGKKQ